MDIPSWSRYQGYLTVLKIEVGNLILVWKAGIHTISGISHIAVFGRNIFLYHQGRGGHQFSLRLSFIWQYPCSNFSFPLPNVLNFLHHVFDHNTKVKVNFFFHLYLELFFFYIISCTIFCIVPLCTSSMVRGPDGSMSQVVGSNNSYKPITCGVGSCLLCK